MKLSALLPAKPKPVLIPCTDLPAKLADLKAKGVRVLAVNTVRERCHTFYTLETDEVATQATASQT